MEIVELLGLLRNVAPPLLYTGNISANEGLCYENVDCDDVQEGAGAQNQTAGLHLQTLRRANLLAELSQASPRSPRALHSLDLPPTTRHAFDQWPHPINYFS
jgi:hypothetical protein